VEPPKGFSDSDEVWRLNKSLYGLKQAPLCWNQKLTELLLQFGLQQSQTDRSMYFSDKLILVVYVDDIMIAANSYEAQQQCLKFLQQHVEVKDLGPISNYLGMKIPREGRSFIVDQENYITKLAEK